MEKLKHLLVTVNREKGFKTGKELSEYIVESTDRLDFQGGGKHPLWHEVLCLGLSANGASELVYPDRKY